MGNPNGAEIRKGRPRRTLPRQRCFEMRKRNAILLAALALLLCVQLCSCSFSFSLESILQSIKQYINGDENEEMPADYVGSFKNDTFEYDLYETYAVITKYTGAATVVTVPSKLEGKPVTAVESLAFYYGTKIKYLALPATLTELRENALYYCEELETVVLPAGLKALGEKAFSWCKSLKSLTLPEGITEIPHFCFNECENLEEIVLPAGITAVGNRAFSGCASLKMLTFGDALRSVGSFAFRRMTDLEEVTLPGPCTLGENAFAECSLELIVHTPADSVCDRMCLEQFVRTDNHPGGEMNIVDGSSAESGTETEN